MAVWMDGQPGSDDSNNINNMLMYHAVISSLGKGYHLLAKAVAG